MVFCGHTFCHACLHKLLMTDDDLVSEIQAEDRPNSQVEYKRGEDESEVNIQGARMKKEIECPECGTKNTASNGVESFPKNLVLL